MPTVTESHVDFVYPDPEDVLQGVSLLQEVARPRSGIPFVRLPGTGEWRLSLPRPNALRLEYRLEVHHPDGGVEVGCDPAADAQATGPFGERSVLEFPGYRPPGWLDVHDVEEGTCEEFSVTSDALQEEVRGLLWRSAGASARGVLPLLVAHDGPEYAQFSSLLRFLDVAVARGQLPPMRAALLAPIDRNRDYTASPVYAYVLTQEVLPALNRLAPTGGRRQLRVGMGASMGALSMLHAHRAYPQSFGGLFLQSGSFFQPRHDAVEAEYAMFGPVTRFVGRVLDSAQWSRPVPVTLTAGSAEENLYNNRDMRDALTKQGYEVRWHEQPDAHNWVSWRDAWDPALIDLLAGLWK